MSLIQFNATLKLTLGHLPNRLGSMRVPRTSVPERPTGFFPLEGTYICLCPRSFTQLPFSPARNATTKQDTWLHSGHLPFVLPLAWTGVSGVANWLHDIFIYFSCSCLYISLCTYICMLVVLLALCCSHTGGANAALGVCLADPRAFSSIQGADWMHLEEQQREALVDWDTICIFEERQMRLQIAVKYFKFIFNFCRHFSKIFSRSLELDPKIGFMLLKDDNYKKDL